MKFVGSDIAQKITAESKNGNVVFANSVAGSADLTAGQNALSSNSTINENLTMKATNQAIINKSKIGNDLTVNAGKIYVNASNSPITDLTEVGGNFTANSQKNVSVYNMTVGEKATLKSGLTKQTPGHEKTSPTYLSNFKAKNLDVESGDNVSIINGSEIAETAKVVAGKDDPNMENATTHKKNAVFFMENSKVGKTLDVETEHGAIHIAGGSIGGNANLTADSKGTDSGNIIIGYNSNDPNVVTDKNSTSIKGNIKAKSNLWTKAYSEGDLKFVDSDIKQNISAESKNGNVVFTNSVAGSADLTAGKDATVENSKVAGDTKLNTVDGNALVTNSEVGKLTMNSTNADVTVENSKVNGTATLTAGHDVNSTFSSYTDKLDATAGHDVNYKTTGDIHLDNSTNMSLKAGNKTELTTIDGNITVDNLPSGTDVVKGKEVSLVAENNITFTGDNVIDGDLRVKSNGSKGFVAINGDSTKADNIYVDKAHWVEIKNVDTDHLQMENFDIGHLIQSRIGSAGFDNGDTLYINILNTVLNGQLVKNLDPAFEINRGTTLADIIYYPLVNPNPGPGSGDGGDVSADDAARLLGYMREKGIDGLVGKDFAPIAFAAYDRGKRGAIFRAAGDAIYKDVSQVVHITDRFNLDD